MLNVYDQMAKMLNAAIGETANGLYQVLNSFMYRPIGLANVYGKNYRIMLAHLNRNIGDFLQKGQERAYTPIGTFADPNYNLRPENAPWFLLDSERKRYYDYIDYVNEIYFRGSKNLINVNHNGIRELSFEDLDPEAANPSVIRRIDDWDANSLISNGYLNQSELNPNNHGMGMDTRLGVVSNYYLDKTIEASDLYAKTYSYSSTQEPTDEMNNAKAEKGTNTNSRSSITKGIYSNFGFDGHYGLKEGNSMLGFGQVATNAEVTGQIIPWSTADHTYDTSLFTNDKGQNNNIQRVASMQNVPQSEVALSFLDVSQDTTRSNTYSPFGNYYSVTYSLGLISSSGSKTQKFIASSMLGYPLTSAIDASEMLQNETIGGTYEEVTDLEGNVHKIFKQYPKKYYALNGTRGTNYLDKITGANVIFVKYGGTTNSDIVRLRFPDAGNDNMWAASTIYEHIEAEGNKMGSQLNTSKTTFNEGVEFGKYKVYDPATISTKQDIIYKTNQLFAANRAKTIISRFHTDEFSSKDDARSNKDYTSTAVSKYGMSRGRNLLKRVPSYREFEDGNGYSNPYCRVWTYHHEYATLNDALRPFDDDGSLVGSAVSAYRTESVQGDEASSWDDGQTRLEKLGARSKTNNLVRFAPTKDEREKVEDQLKHLMFSIENLAWKGCTDHLCEDQRGPLGGRIMWFPPYNLKFNETASVSWNEVEFIGRGEKIPTYINTSRGGTLSFDILIDHPSVVNSYRNKGIGGEGIGDVDDTSSYEQTLLRFFAGCEVLDRIDGKPSNPIQKTPPAAPHPVVIPTSSAKKIFAFGFFVFFPNDYSGVDDRNVNSKSTQDTTSTEDEGSSSLYFPTAYLMRGNGAGYGIDSVNGGWYTQSIDVTPHPYCNGYEMYNGLGLSGDGQIKYPKDYDAEQKKGNTGACSFVSKKGRKWAYRVDSRCQEERLLPENYVDNNSFGLNSHLGYKKTFGYYTLDANEKQDLYFAMSEVFAAVELKGNETMVDNFNSTTLGDASVNLCDVKRMKQLLGIMDSMLSAKKITVVVSGFASKHGYRTSNSRLSTDRYMTIKTWLQRHPLFKGNNVVFQEGETVEASFTKSERSSVNDLEPKVGRAVRVQIFIDAEEVTAPSSNAAISNMTIADNNTALDMQETQNWYLGEQASGDESRMKKAHDAVLEKATTDPRYLSILTALEDIERQKTQQIANAKAQGVSAAALEGWKNNQDAQETSDGYRNEYKFFSELQKNDAFLHSKIVDKFKFFDPAFHSITPEGFQSRLTFLHQCTRQGSTSAWTDGMSIRSASNLAFGRPPILVLRIGDFFNTKIVITNMTINYENGGGISWDLNDEGIGVMPMYAQISLNFNFYGGSELGGPVSRLQNAVSFNYYANTSVYDHRADMIDYATDGTGKINKYKVTDIK